MEAKISKKMCLVFSIKPFKVNEICARPMDVALDYVEGCH